MVTYAKLRHLSTSPALLLPYIPPISFSSLFRLPFTFQAVCRKCFSVSLEHSSLSHFSLWSSMADKAEFDSRPIHISKGTVVFPHSVHSPSSALIPLSTCYFRFWALISTRVRCKSPRLRLLRFSCTVGLGFLLRWQPVFG